MIDFNIQKILPLCETFGLTLDTDAQNRLNTYGNMLLDYNERINLTAITEPGEVLFKHFYDCLLFFKAVDLKENAKIIDVGTGAGFPGLVLKIARPDIELTLLDGLDKRLKFLSDVLSETELSAELLHLRAEDGGKDTALREQFDIACARAVAPLPILSELCIPFVKTGGMFVAMKGSNGQEEIKQSLNAFKILGCEKPTLKQEKLRENEERCFIISKKISQTSPKYPRNYGKIKKSAL